MLKQFMVYTLLLCACFSYAETVPQVANDSQQINIRSERYERLIKCRQKIFDAVKKRDKIELVNVIQISRQEFGETLLMSNNERLMTKLILKEFDEIKNEESLVQYIVSSPGPLGYFEHRSYRNNELNQHEFQFNDVAMIPDLTEHLNNWYKESSISIIEEMKSKAPDLFEYIELQKDQSQFSGNNYHKDEIYNERIIAYIRKYESSTITKYLRARYRYTLNTGEWSGNGLILGMGASSLAFDDYSIHEIRIGIYVDLYIAICLGIGVFSFDTKVMTNKLDNDELIGDTTIVKGTDLNSMVLNFTWGPKYELYKNAIINPYIGYGYFSKTIPTPTKEEKDIEFQNISCISTGINVLGMFFIKSDDIGGIGYKYGPYFTYGNIDTYFKEHGNWIIGFDVALTFGLIGKKNL